MAFAQPPAVSAQGAVGAALGPPAQPKVVTPPAPPTVTPGTGEDAGAAQAKAAALAAAIASGDVRKALEAGATAADMVRMAQAAGVAGPLVNADPSLAAFVRDPNNGFFVLGYSGPGSYFMYRPAAFAGYEPPGGLASLPTMTEQFGPLPPPPMTTAVGQLFAAGLPAQDVGKAVLTAAGIGSPLYDLDTKTARFVQTPDGGVGVAMTKTGGAGLSGHAHPQFPVLPESRASLPQPPRRSRRQARPSADHAHLRREPSLWRWC